jgi:hypothetical protein
VIARFRTRRRVRRGARFLDNHLPNWRKMIDLNTLNMLRGDLCILGQIYSNDYNSNGYGTGILRLGIHSPHDLGFTTKAAGSDDERWNVLAEEWRRELVLN